MRVSKFQKIRRLPKISYISPNKNTKLSSNETLIFEISYYFYEKWCNVKLLSRSKKPRPRSGKVK